MSVKQFSQQIYMFSAETTKKFSKKFPLLSHFQRETRLENFTQELAEKSFAERYEPLYFLGLLIAFVAQALSIWSSYAAVEKLVQIKIHHPDILLGVTLALLLLIEVIKFYLVHLSLRDIFALKPIYPYPLLAAALLWSLGSIYLSVSGSSELAQDRRQEQTLSTEQAGKEKALKAEIAQIQNNDSYKSIVWDGAGKTAKILTEAGKALVQKREQELDSLRKTYKAKNQDFQLTQAQNIKNYNFFFALWEILFLACTWGIFYYKRMSAIEKQILPEATFEVPTSENNFASKQFAELQSQVQELTAKLQSALQQKPSNELQTPLYSSAKDLTELLNNPVSNFETTPKLEENKSEELSTDNHQPTTTEIDTERLFQELLAKYSNGNATYLRKYQKAVEMILKLKIQNLPTAEIEKKVCAKQKFSPSTFYTIWRLINNTKTE